MNMTNLNGYDTKGYKVRLYPNRKQKKLLFKCFEMSKFVYNLCIDIQEEYYETIGKFKDVEEEFDMKIYKRLPQYELDKKIKNLKYTDKYKWLTAYNAESIKGAIMDCCKAYTKCDNLNLNNKHPRYKTSMSKKQFYTTPGRLSIMKNCVRLSSIGKIKYCNSYGDEILGNGYANIKSMRHIKYYNSRVSYDGLNFYLSFTILKDQDHQINSYKRFSGNEEWVNQDYYKDEQTCDSIGIDVGLKNEKWLVDSTGRVVERPDSDKLRKRISRLQRKYQRQKDTNLKKNPNFFKYHPNGSKNMQKTLARINKDFKKINNRRNNVVHEYACDLIKLKPKTIILESTISNHIISNNNYKKKGRHKINQMVSDAALYESTMIIERKMINNGITVIRADSGYPSSQICSCCGYRQNIGRKEIYKCPNCGTIINRDLNAAINLANYMRIKDIYI